mmetsp:Transcript_14537/g.17302  ORF Transcript_14537/g.17302 Transcript_14537/m.17302 type:complete len:82 (-) Transcript_14537:492-737(-)
MLGKEDATGDDNECDVTADDTDDSDDDDGVGGDVGVSTNTFAAPTFCFPTSSGDALEMNTTCFNHSRYPSSYTAPTSTHNI